MNKSPWTKQEDDTIRKLHAQRVPYKTIARVLDRSPGAVGQRVYSLRLKRDPLPTDHHVATSLTSEMYGKLITAAHPLTVSHFIRTLIKDHFDALERTASDRTDGDATVPGRAASDAEAQRGEASSLDRARR